VKPFTTIAVLVFAIICLAHLLRVVFAWEAEVDHIVIPVWLSAIGALFSGMLAVMLWKENK